MNLLKPALRRLRAQPLTSALIVVTLGLAVGATTAVYGFVDALLLRPFPFRDPDRLVEIRSLRGGEPGKLSMREVLEIGELPGIAAIAAHTGAGGGYNYGGDGRPPEEWRAILTTSNLWDVLGVPLALGTPWPEVANRQRDFRVVLGHAVWRRAFGGQHVVGRKIALDHAPGYEVHGVAPPGFDFPRGVEVFRSIGGFTSYDDRGRRNVVAIARLGPGVGLVELRSRLAALAAELAARHPETNRGLALEARGFRELFVGPARPYLLLVAAASVFVLLIAGANVVNLLLAQAVGRGREMTVRSALGAGRGRLIVQLLCETAVFSLLAAGLGAALATVAVRGLVHALRDELPGWLVVGVDGRVLAFAVAASLVAGLGAGLLPALHLARPSLATALRETARGASESRWARGVREAQIVVQVAAAVLLVAAAGLVVRGFDDLLARDRGFDAAGLETFRVALGWRRYGGPAIATYYEKAEAALRAIPGVEAVAQVDHPPLARQEVSSPVTVRSEEQADDEHNPYVRRQVVSEGLFPLLGMPLVAGRGLLVADTADSPPVVVVSARLAARLWPGTSPLGRRLRLGRHPDEPWRSVVGVARDVAHELGGRGGYDVYLPYRQAPAANQYLLCRTTLPAMEFRRRAERALWGIDPEQSMFDFQSYEARIAASAWTLGVARRVLSAFALVALALASGGVFGVLSHAAAQRQRELGIRLALGASPRGVAALVASHGLRLCGAGLALGAVLVLVVVPPATRQLAELPAFDGASLLGALAALAAVTLVGSLWPARAAARADVAIALRAE